VGFSPFTPLCSPAIQAPTGVGVLSKCIGGRFSVHPRPAAAPPTLVAMATRCGCLSEVGSSRPQRFRGAGSLCGQSGDRMANHDDRALRLERRCHRRGQIETVRPNHHARNTPVVGSISVCVVTVFVCPALPDTGCCVDTIIEKRTSRPTELLRTQRHIRNCPRRSCRPCRLRHRGCLHCPESRLHTALTRLPQ
jgi:hypothetical protein